MRIAAFEVEQPEKDAVLELQVRQVGLMVNADFSGLVISLKR